MAKSFLSVHGCARWLEALCVCAVMITGGCADRTAQNRGAQGCGVNMPLANQALDAKSMPSPASHGQGVTDVVPAQSQSDSNPVGHGSLQQFACVPNVSIESVWATAVSQR